MLILSTLSLIAFFVFNLQRARGSYWDQFYGVEGLPRPPFLELWVGLVIRTARGASNVIRPPFITWWLKTNAVSLTAACGVYVIAVTGAIYVRQILRPVAAPSQVAQAVATPDKIKELRRTSIELKKALENNPDDAATQLRLARTLRDLGAAEEAMNAYRKALSLKPRMPEAMFELARLAAATGEVNLALAKAKELGDLWPKRPESSLLLAQIAFIAKDQEQARRQWQSALNLDPVNREARCMLVSSYLEQGNYAEAARLAEIGMKLTPDDDDLRLFLARSLDGMGRSAEALILLQGVSAKERTEPLLLALANIQVKLREYLPAIATYEDLLQRFPDNIVALNNLAMLHADHGYDLERAATLASTLYTKFLNDAGACDTMGWVLFKQGKQEQALVLLRQGATGMPENASHRYHYGAALLKAGQREVGRHEVATALKLSGSFDGATQARVLLSGKKEDF